MKLGNVYVYIYEENAPKLKFLGVHNKQYKFKNLITGGIEIFQRAAIQGMREVKI